MSKSISHSLISRKRCCSGLAFSLVIVFAAVALSFRAHAQDQYDPPARVARLGYMQGSVSFQPSGETDWVQADSNRPMTIGDRLWADRDSHAEVELGSASIHLAANTGISFLNLDDRTVQVELSSGIVDIRVRRLDRNDVFEIDTPNEAFTVYQPGRYRIEAAEDGNTSVVTIREGEGEATGNGQTYTLHAGQRTTFTGINPLNAAVEQVGPPDDFDNWSYTRERRYDDSRSARYCSRELVGFEDLDDYGDWQTNQEYGGVWFPRVSADWAPYREGHWTWIDPWGWTWVDDDPWGYAPFHYGRWASFGGRWGWIPGPPQADPVYAPALVVFVGGGGAFGDNVGWFPLGPREVYVPSYPVSRGYVDRVNITNTAVTATTITNVYNTTVVNQGATINRINYVNHTVEGAVTAVPQQAFASGQSVNRSAVRVNTQALASAPVVSRLPVAPARQAVLGAHANTANRVATPPRALASRQVIAKATPPPPLPSFAARQQILQSHPGQPVPRQELQKLQPAHTDTQPVKQAPPGKPATPSQAVNRPPNQPASRPANSPANPGTAERPGTNPTQPNTSPPKETVPNNQPEASRPAEPPAHTDRPPAAAQPNNPPSNEPTPNNRPESRPEPSRSQPPSPPPTTNRPPAAPPNNRPPNEPIPNTRPEPSRPEPNRAAPPPPPPNRPSAAPPNNRPPNEPTPNTRPEPSRPEPNRSQPNHGAEQRPAPGQPATRPDVHSPEEQARPATHSPKQNEPAERTKPSEQRKPEQQPPQ